MSAEKNPVSGLSKTKHLLKNVQDYSRAVVTLTWQRQSIFAAVAMLTGWFFTPWKAALFFAVCMACEYIDLLLARKVHQIENIDIRATKRVHVGFICNTTISALAISIYAVWVGLSADGVGLFTALFCLFAAALYAALNNHQIASTLAIRLTLYGVSFLIITARDLWVYRPPLSSEMWLQFFTVIFVMYFLIDCSLGFLRMYRQDLERHDALKVEHERAKTALVLKSQFVAIVSHELRTPLTSIKGSLDLINSGKFGDFSPQVQHLLSIAGRNSKRLADLVDDLLDLQKIDEGKMKFENERIAVSTLIDDAIQSHQGLAEKYNVHLEFTNDNAQPIYVHADPSRLMQVLGNVISNAAKFSPAGSPVEIWFEAANKHVQIFVRDHGVGIPEGEKDAVFGRFTQVDASDQRSFGGTGLGMSISRSIIDKLGGTIDYESKLGVGTTFSIELPCATAPDTSCHDNPKRSSSDTTELNQRIAVRA